VTAPTRSPAHGARRAARRRLLALGLAPLLASCGFRPRGDVQYAFQTLYVNAPADDPFIAELRRAIEGAAGSVLVANAKDAQAVLDVLNHVTDKEVLSLSGGGRVREFLLIKRATIFLRDAAGRDWLPGGQIVIRRSYTFNESEVLAREAQEARLLREMQTDLVQQIVRRLQAARRPAA
jgi:LPS-assembly lipoprotein